MRGTSIVAVAIVALGLSACVAYPDGPDTYTYAPYPGYSGPYYYYGPPAYATGSFYYYDGPRHYRGPYHHDRGYRHGPYDGPHDGHETDFSGRRR